MPRDAGQVACTLVHRLEALEISKRVRRNTTPCGATGAHRDGVGLLAEGEADRLDQEGLPRARLPGNHVQARGERDTDVLEDGQVADGELDQHRGGTVTALPTSAWCAGR